MVLYIYIQTDTLNNNMKYRAILRAQEDELYFYFIGLSSGRLMCVVSMDVYT